MKPLLTATQVAELLACSRALVYEMGASGQLPAVRLGTGKARQALRWAPEIVEAFVKKGGRAP